MKFILSYFFHLVITDPIFKAANTLLSCTYTLFLIPSFSPSHNMYNSAVCLSSALFHAQFCSHRFRQEKKENHVTLTLACLRFFFVTLFNILLSITTVAMKKKLTAFQVPSFGNEWLTA